MYRPGYGPEFCWGCPAQQQLERFGEFTSLNNKVGGVYRLGTRHSHSVEYFSVVTLGWKLAAVGIATQTKLKKIFPNYSSRPGDRWTKTDRNGEVSYWRPSLDLLQASVVSRYATLGNIWLDNSMGVYCKSVAIYLSMLISSLMLSAVQMILMVNSINHYVRWLYTMLFTVIPQSHRKLELNSACAVFHQVIVKAQ